MIKTLTILLILLCITGHSAEQKKIFKTDDIIWGFDFIDQKKFGPVAVYRLHKQGRVGVAKSYLTLEVVDCPGPPLKQEAVDAVPESVKQILNP